MKASHRNSLVYVKLKFIKQIKNPRKVFHTRETCDIYMPKMPIRFYEIDPWLHHSSHLPNNGGSSLRPKPFEFWRKKLFKNKVFSDPPPAPPVIFWIQLLQKEEIYYLFWTYWNQRNPFFHFQVSEKNQKFIKINKCHFLDYRVSLDYGHFLTGFT